ncbi:MAG: LPS export ABC transporter periplasmic protein LptC [Elusimicrobiales bacterium]|nr:LPS export ABC transporter periplasmic protein LptC [Elusimicrobiales bacterium]
MRKLAFFLLPALLAGCSGADSREAAPGVSLLKDFSIAETAGGLSSWRLDSRSARMDEKAGLIRFDSPRIKFYDADKPSSEITSRAGLLRMQEKAAELTDEVRVNSMRDGMQLHTTRLFYSSARGKIWTDEAVTIYKGRTVITGRGFTANPDLSQIQIEHQETRVASK